VEHLAAGTGDRCFHVIRMDIGFHSMLLLQRSK
jgi:hypothetical protein